MNALAWQVALLAGDPRLEKFAKQFQARKLEITAGQILVGLLVVTLVMSGLWCLSRIIEQRSGRRQFDSSLGLFITLCGAHGLKWSQRWLLWKLARGQELQEPARLFVEPDRFKTEHLTGRLKPRAAELQEIARRLFAVPAEADKLPALAIPTKRDLN